METTILRKIYWFEVLLGVNNPLTGKDNSQHWSDHCFLFNYCYTYLRKQKYLEVHGCDDDLWCTCRMIKHKVAGPRPPASLSSVAFLVFPERSHGLLLSNVNFNVSEMKKFEGFRYCDGVTRLISQRLAWLRLFISFSRQPVAFGRRLRQQQSLTWIGGRHLYP